MECNKVVFLVLSCSSEIYIFQRTTVVTGIYEPNDEEADWPSDKEDEDELSVSVSFSFYTHCYHSNSLVMTTL